MMMKKLFALLVAFVASITMAISVSAQGKIYVGYCDGQIATTSSGKITNSQTRNATIDLAICLPKSVLQSYVGCQITGVNYAQPVATMCESFTMWVRETQNGSNIITGTIRYPKYGWNEIPATSAYTITGEENELWIGMSYPQENSVYNVISFAGPTNKLGCFVGTGGSFVDYSGYNWGSLSLEAIVEGSVTTRDLVLADVSTRQHSYQVGKPIVVTGTIQNAASTAAVNPVINYSLAGGQVTGSYTHQGTVKYRESVPFEFEVPTTSLTLEGTLSLDVELVWTDGGTDEVPANNKASLTVELLREVYTRRMVVEESTGAWCGWCVRGIVGLREMKAKYGDDFIGIAVHNGDKYRVADYDNYMSNFGSGFPRSTINRSGSQVDPSFANLQSRYDAMEKVADAGLEVSASVTGNQITFNSTTKFTFSDINTDYRIAFVVLENQLQLTQANYYSGSGSMAEFGSLSDPCNILVDDVARGIFPTPGGQSGAIPSSIISGEPYEYSLTTTMPAYSNGNNVEVVALLINGRTGEIIQGAKTAEISGLNADPGTNPGGDPQPEEDPLTPAFTPASGSSVSQLHTINVTFSGTGSQEINTIGYYNWYMRYADMDELPVNGRPYLRADNGQVAYRACRVDQPANPDYFDPFEDEPYIVNQFNITFDGVAPGHYTLVIPKSFFVYYKDASNNLYGSQEFVAEYTVTEGSQPSELTEWSFSSQPAVDGVVNKLDVVTLYSDDWIYAYNNSTMLALFKYYYVEEVRRPYLITPTGAEVQVNYVDDITPDVSDQSIFQLTFPTQYAQGTYTMVIPADFMIVCGRFDGEKKGYAGQEKRVQYHVGQPSGVDAIVTGDVPAVSSFRKIYDAESQQIIIVRDGQRYNTMGQKLNVNNE